MMQASLFSLNVLWLTVTKQAAAATLKNCVTQRPIKNANIVSSVFHDSAAIRLFVFNVSITRK